MKKILPVFLAILLLASLMSGCAFRKWFEPDSTDRFVFPERFYFG